MAREFPERAINRTEISSEFEQDIFLQVIMEHCLGLTPSVVGGESGLQITPFQTVRGHRRTNPRIDCKPIADYAGCGSQPQQYIPQHAAAEHLWFLNSHLIV